MVAFEPDVEKIREPAVLGNVFRREMTVVVEDGLWSGVSLIKPACNIVGQQKIVIEEGWHRETFSAGRWTRHPRHEYNSSTTRR